MTHCGPVDAPSSRYAAALLECQVGRLTYEVTRAQAIVAMSPPRKLFLSRCTCPRASFPAPPGSGAALNSSSRFAVTPKVMDYLVHLQRRLLPGSHVSVPTHNTNAPVTYSIT